MAVETWDFAAEAYSIIAFYTFLFVLFVNALFDIEKEDFWENFGTMLLVSMLLGLVWPYSFYVMMREI